MSGTIWLLAKKPGAGGVLQLYAATLLMQCIFLARAQLSADGKEVKRCGE
jgi:hypothetical protein